MEEKTTRPVSEILKTLATLESAEPASTTAKPPAVSSYVSRMRSASAKWRETWIKQRLAMVRYHHDVSKLEEAIWKFCIGIATSPGRGKRFVVYGNNGNGKSRCMRAVRRFIQDRAIDLPLVTNPNGDAGLVDCMLVNWAQQVDEWKKDGTWDVQEHINTNVLLIDDIGAEHDPSKVGLEKLYLILERREWKWTMITTNKHPEGQAGVPNSGWEQCFERRIADRLFRNAEHVDLSKLPSFAAQ